MDDLDLKEYIKKYLSSEDIDGIDVQSIKTEFEDASTSSPSSTSLPRPEQFLFGDITATPIRPLQPVAINYQHGPNTGQFQAAQPGTNNFQPVAHNFQPVAPNVQHGSTLMQPDQPGPSGAAPVQPEASNFQPGVPIFQPDQPGPAGAANVQHGQPGPSHFQPGSGSTTYQAVFVNHAKQGQDAPDESHVSLPTLKVVKHPMKKRTSGEISFHENISILGKKVHHLNRKTITSGYDARSFTPIFMIEERSVSIRLNEAEMKKLLNSLLLRHLADNTGFRTTKCEEPLSLERAAIKKYLAPAKENDEIVVYLVEKVSKTGEVQCIKFEQIDAHYFIMFKGTFESQREILVALSKSVSVSLRGWHQNFETVETEICFDGKMTFSTVARLASACQFWTRDLIDYGYQCLFNDYLHYFIITRYLR